MKLTGQINVEMKEDKAEVSIDETVNGWGSWSTSNKEYFDNHDSAVSYGKELAEHYGYELSVIY